MMEMLGPFNSGAAVGGNGVATANATSTVKASGLLNGIRVRYNDSPPAATTVVTIEATGGVLPTRTILTLTNTATSGYFAVRSPEYKADGTATGGYAISPLLADQIKVTIAGANAGDSVDVWLHVIGD